MLLGHTPVARSYSAKPPRLDVHGTLPHRLLPSGRARRLARRVTALAFPSVPIAAYAGPQPATLAPLSRPADEDDE